MKDPYRIDAAALLRKHGLRPRHRLGQNFLEDTAILRQIVDAGDPRPTDTILEIGCGLGALTIHLAREAQKVIAVEIDPRLAEVAKAELGSLANVVIVQADILTLTPQELGLPPEYLVAANIPYYITSPILRHLLESQPKPRRIVLAVQQEVAARICAAPPDMSLLAVSVQVYGTARVVASVPAEAFFPRPKVDSAIVCIECHEEPAVPIALLPSFFATVKAGFSHPRKMLGNTLASGLGLSPVEARARIASVGIDPQRRAETLALVEWARLCEALQKPSN